MRRTQADRLIEKYLDGTANPEERHAVESSINKHLEQSNPLRNSRELLDAEQANRKAVLAAIGDPRYQIPATTRRLFKHTLPYAAAILLVAATISYFSIDKQRPSDVRFAATEILPGGNRATLTLADGRVIALSSEHEGIVVQDGITYLDGSEVIENGKLKMESEKPTFNSITTPKGGTYAITLPDGSRVWLNAASTLKYPGRFSGDSREVFLEGEAFFEVRKSGRPEVGKPVPPTPFIVKTSSQTVEVLGTEFNVSAYAEEEATKTTLVEGKVIVTPGISSDYTLSPGQQATTRGASTTVQEVEVASYVAWKNGIFYFEDTPLVDAMNQLSRWYDVEVVYADNIPQTHFYGQIGRSKTLSEALAIFAESGVKFRIEKLGETNKLIVLSR